MKARKKLLLIFVSILFLIGILIINFNPVINETKLAKNKAELLKYGIIEINPGVTNCFLIKNDNKYVLIDTSYEHDWKTFKNALNEVGVSESNISHIILTHHHDDHVGLVNKLTTENKDIQVVMSDSTKDLILKGENDRNHNGGFINKKVKQIKIIHNKFNNNYNELRFTPYKARENDIIITKDIELKDIGIDIEGAIIKTPGHSKDSISIILENGFAFVGDAAANMPIMQMAGANYCVLVLEDLNEYYKSWEKISLHNAKVILPSHGNSFAVEVLYENKGKNNKNDMVSNK